MHTLLYSNTRMTTDQREEYIKANPLYDVLQRYLSPSSTLNPSEKHLLHRLVLLHIHKASHVARKYYFYRFEQKQYHVREYDHLQTITNLCNLELMSGAALEQYAKQCASRKNENEMKGKSFATMLFMYRSSQNSSSERIELPAGYWDDMELEYIMEKDASSYYRVFSNKDIEKSLELAKDVLQSEADNADDDDDDEEEES